MKILLAVVSVVIVLAMIIGHLINRRRRWDPPIYPFECFPCRTRYKTPQQLVAHLHGNHGMDFEHAKITVLKGYRLSGGS